MAVVFWLFALIQASFARLYTQNELNEWAQTSDSSSDFVVLPWPNTPSDLHVTRLEGVYASTSRPYTAVAAVTATWESFSFALPNNGCQDHRNVSGFFFVSFGGSSSSVASETFDCDFATNAGFFAFTPPACVGNIVAMGDQVQLPATGNVNFGTTKDKRTVVGYLNSSALNDFQFQNLLSGTGWLVRDGTSYVNKSREFSPSSGFVTEKAPRTAVSVLHNGSLAIVVVDGIESTKEGPDLYEFAELLITIGAYHAVNLDGGGSTTAVYKQQVFNRPTCQDTPEPICERDVTTITCIKQ